MTDQHAAEAEISDQAPLQSFDAFAPGDVAIFQQSFESDDFERFANLSGDWNPLHPDAEHAAGTLFKKPIVPLHLTAAPLSRIAGMIFPGKPSVYLGHELRAVAPAYYGDRLTYSARIEAVNAAQRILTLQVLVLRGVEIVVEASMRVQATEESWRGTPKTPILRTACPGRALVTGASGEIGRACALALGLAGWRILIQDRGPDARRDALVRDLERLTVEPTFVEADLATDEGRANLADAVLAAAEAGDPIEAVVHAASAPVTASLGDLAATNYEALRAIVGSALPAMLARQKGRIVFVSSAMIRGVPGWEDYVAAKTMATGYLSGLDHRFSAYGVRAMSILPGIVATPFSAPYRDGASALAPEEVGACVLEMVETPSASAVVLEVGRRENAAYGLRFPSAPTAPSVEAATASGAAPTAHAEGEVLGANWLEAVVRRRLRLADDVDIADGGLGVTPGWDSLSQIELMLEIEAKLGVAFTSSEIASLTRYAELERVVANKRGSA